MLNIRAIVCMGVSGCGKSSVAKALAEKLGYDYHDADNYHPEANKKKMRAGIPLDDEDRAPWLHTLSVILDGAFHEHSRGIVLACSALKRHYRDVLRRGRDHTQLLFVHLRGSKELILDRYGAVLSPTCTLSVFTSITSMIERQKVEGHYMPPSLLDSQFHALEVPTPDEHALSIDIDTPIDHIVNVVIGHLS